MITGAEIETFCYPTEDLEKVKKAFLAISPVPPEISRGSTHFGQDLLILRARLKRKKEIKELLNRLSGLPEDEKRELLDTLDTRLDEKGNFYLRLDKFGAFEGELRLAKGSAIRVKIKFTTYPLDKESIIQEIENEIL